MNSAARIGRFLRGSFGRGTIFSVLLHALALLLLASLTLRMESTAPEPPEVTFISGERGVVPSGTALGAGPPGPQAPPPQPTPKQEPVRQEPVTLPPRRMLEQEPPERFPRSGNKVDLAQAMPQVAVPSLGTPEGDKGLRPSTPGAEAKEAAPTTTAVGQKEAPPAAPGPTAGAQESFRIEGEAAHRQIIYKLIPEYPPGLQREAVVRVRFTILPDGSVGAMVPVLKGDPTLEQITLQALRQWRFNALPPHVPQIEVTGIITFRYLLR